MNSAGSGINRIYRLYSKEGLTRTCHGLVPPPVRVQANWRSKAKGLLPANAVCRRRGL